MQAEQHHFGSPSCRPKVSRFRRGFFGFVLTFTSLATGLVLAGDRPSPTISAAERAITLFAKPVSSRLVVRADSNDLDVWLISNVAFAKSGERLSAAAAARLALPGGFAVQRATWLEPDGTWWVDVMGQGKKLRVLAKRHGKGTLFVLRGLGHSSDAQPWAPPYRPLPLNLPHGPLRP
ncbi:MAG: hypothetical protein KC502_02860 [Myxococcales bacterium]|nr:hypothetical protein [Myxococcales bacterium]